MINVVDRGPEQAAETLKAVHSQVPSDFDEADDVLVFASQDSYSLARQLVPNLSRWGMREAKLMPYRRSRAKDVSIGKTVHIDDNVTPILDSLVQMSSMADQRMSEQSPTVLISLACSNDSQAIPTAGIRSLFEQLVVAEDHSVDILLLRKVFRLTSLSDWHDLQVIGLTISNDLVREWVRILDSTFLEYSDRKVFNMIEPRPAILEANKQMSEAVLIRKIRSGYLCTFDAYSEAKIANCDASKVAIKINCVRMRGKNRIDPCSAEVTARLIQKIGR